MPPPEGLSPVSPEPTPPRGSADTPSTPISTDQVELRDGYAEVGEDVRLHYVEAGAGPLIVLLHGFPEFWYGWRLHVSPPATAGFRVAAPDLRGYRLHPLPASLAP